MSISPLLKDNILVAGYCTVYDDLPQVLQCLNGIFTRGLKSLGVLYEAG